MAGLKIEKHENGYRVVPLEKDAVPKGSKIVFIGDSNFTTASPWYGNCMPIKGDYLTDWTGTWEYKVTAVENNVIVAIRTKLAE